MKFNITKTQKAAFVTAVIAGFMAFGYMMANNFLTYDSLWNIYSDQNMISSGRPFLKYAAGISSDYNLPWLNGCLAIIYLALSALILVRLFNPLKVLTAAVIGGFVTVFPAVTSTFSYGFTVDAYMLAVLLAVLSVYICVQRKYGFVAGIFLLGLSIGIYQAYFSYAIVLCIVFLLMQLLRKEKLRNTLLYAAKFIIMGVFAYIFYVCSLKLMLLIEGEALSGYQGTDTVVGFKLSSIPAGLKTAFVEFFNFARYENVLTTTLLMKVAFVIIVLMAVAIYVALFIKNKCVNTAKIIIALILFGAIPFGTTMIAIMVPDANFHLLMRMPWAILFVFAALLFDEFERTNIIIKYRPLISEFSLIACCVMIFEFIVMGNVAGFNMNERYEKSYAFCLKIENRLESTDGYHTGDKVAILGGIPNENCYPSTEITINDLSGYFGTNGELCVNSTEKCAEFMRHYLGFSISTISDEEEIALTETKEFIEMDYFPASDSIRKIGDVWVIKING